MQKISFMKNDFKNSTYKKHFHNTYSISLITKGECNFCIEGTKFTATKGLVRVINPYEIHEIYDSSWEHINLVLTAYFMQSITKDMKPTCRGGNVCFSTITEDKKLAQDLQNLYSSRNHQEISTQTKRIIRHMVQKYSYQDFDRTALHVEKSRLKNAISYMYQNANNLEITLDEIASCVQISKYHFLREFKKEFGLTPYQYIQNIKINNARRMLYLDVSLSEIAQECGFFDQSHFIKTYKNYFGHTPSYMYKKQ
ncbi:MAG: AraC family transcriptional regulator [Campylobacteraceae bacterium]|nr:AraC family transcriptional regulator [Campylobacteraceae bacterium]